MSFDARKAELAALIARARIVSGRRAELNHAVEDVLVHRDLFERAAAATTVHVAMLMALSIREMSGRVDCYLGNGQRLSMRTTIVPKNRGPFTGPNAFVDGCVDACRIDGLDKVAARYGWEAVVGCYFAEEFNGDGYRRRGIPSPYVFGATTVQRAGKYVADHQFDARIMDPQLGVLAIFEELASIDPKLAIPGLPAEKQEPDHGHDVAIVPVAQGPDVRTFQSYINRLHAEGYPLTVDGSFGRRSRLAMRAYQAKKRLAQTWSLNEATMKSLIADVETTGA